jgi:SAM-dependent methyltransferase
VLLAPERLHRQPGGSNEVDVRRPPYEECYQERSLYSSLANDRVTDGRLLARLRTLVDSVEPSSFPEPPESWHDGGSTANAYALAFRHLAPVAGLRVVQIGGLGTHAIKMLHAGAESAIVVSPVIDELLAGRALAEALGMAERCVFVAGIAEHLPLATGSIDRIYSGSSIHHTVTATSLPECARVLAPGGRFASIDVWRSGRLYDLGITVFGKRHQNQFCHALDATRLTPAQHAFTDVTITHHGSFVRYPLGLGERLGRRLGPSTAQRWTAAEDRWAERLPTVGRRTASLVLVRGSA